MPNRILRDGIIDSKVFNSLSDDAQLFYYRLISIVDDFGRFEADMELLRVKMFGRSLDRWPLTRVSQALTDVSQALTDDGHMLVSVYRVASKNYLQINKFNQRLRVKKSKCPPPDGHLSVECQSIVGHLPASAEAEAEAEAEVESEAETHSKSGAQNGSIATPRPQLGSVLDQYVLESIGRIAARHPKASGIEIGKRMLMDLMLSATDPEGNIKSIERKHQKFCESNDWIKENHRYCPKLSNWIADGGYMDPDPNTRVDDYESQIPSRGPVVF